MTKRTKTWMIVVGLALALEGWAIYVVGISPERWRPAMVVRDEPAARAVYEAMIQTIRSANTLSYDSVCGDAEGRASFYKVRLAKPGLFRVELLNIPSLKDATLVGDGNDLWLFWSGTRSYLWFDDEAGYEKTKSNRYLKKPVAAGRDSIAEEIARIGIAWYACILDPSTFYGRTSELDPYVDGIRLAGTDKADGEKCDVIEISFLKAQRTQHLWISRQDHLPRRIKEILRVADNKIVVEEWSNIRVNDALPRQTFTWSPPADWKPWSVPQPQDLLIQSGQDAPDFELSTLDGNKVKLSDYRGKVVWLYLWRCGSPQCRQELPHLQKWYEKNRNDDLVVFGVNSTDDKRILQAFLRENPVTFPVVHDCSSFARKAVQDYGDKTATMPMSCIIDRQGKVVDAWLGYEGNHQRAMNALEKAGLRVTTDN